MAANVKKTKGFRAKGPSSCRGGPVKPPQMPEENGRGSMRRVSRELDLPEDHVAVRMSRGTMDVGVFFAVVEKLGLDPRMFLTQEALAVLARERWR